MPQPPIDLGIWIDDPPRIVLREGYLDPLRSLPLSHVAVMADGPEPGLVDQRWDRRDLEALARALPHHHRVLTLWVSAERRALDELVARVPGMLEALGSIVFEGDIEPIGHFKESDVRGFVDEDLDGRELDDAAAAIAQALVELPVCEIEVTTFPGALRVALSLLEELARRASPAQRVRLWAQLYAVLTRAVGAIAWDGRLGPVRFPRDGLVDLREQVPASVEVCAGLAAYDTVWPGHGESMLVAAESAILAGSPGARWWSSKWLCRKAGAQRRRRQLERLVERSTAASSRA